MKWLFILVFMYCAAVAAQAANVAVGPSSTGNGTGSDWNNLKAWSGTPARGDTWYLVDGTYSAKTFSVAASGTTLISIKKATSNDHGGITVGWSDSMGDGQATIGRLTITTSYWLFDGQNGDGAFAVPPDTTASHYGFNFNDGTNCLYLGNPSSTTTDTEFRHIYALATTNDVEKIFCQGQQSTTFVRNNVTISHCLLDGWQNGFMTRGQGSSSYSGCVWEYNVCLNGSSTSSNHGEWINPNERPLSGIIIRYNIFKGYTGPDGQTGTIVANNSDNTGAQIYGNVFDNVRVGNGIVTGTSAGDMVNAVVYNNTFLSATGDSGAWINGPGSGNIAKNNLIYNMAASPGSGWTHDYNAFYSTSGTPSETNGQIASGNPFKNSAGMDYTLVANTTPGTALVPPYNIDPRGVSRSSWSRGAYEFGGKTPTPTPTPTATPTPTPKPTPTPSPSATPGEGVTIEAESVQVSAPFVVTGGYISQPSTTDLTGGGRAGYNFNLTQAGDYVITAFVNGPSLTANSFYVNIDAEPQDPVMTWDILPPTVGFEDRLVSWRGSGSGDDDEFVPMVFHLTAGTHQVIFRGREGNTQLDRFTISMVPSAPDSLRIVP